MELEKAKIIIGTLQWGSTWLDDKFLNRGGNLTDEQLEEIFKCLLDGGVRHMDTAEGYGGGTSESRIGAMQWKTGTQMKVMTKYLPTFWRWTMSAFERALVASNQRLGTECADCYLLHSPVSLLPIEWYVEAAAQAYRKKLLKSFGLSNCDAGQVRRAHAAAQKHGVPLVCNQIMFSLLSWKNQQLQDTVALCQSLNITVVAYSPIGQGLLTDGLTRDKLKALRIARMTGITYDSVQPLRREIQTVAAEHKGASMAQIALAWCRAKGAVPLVGCRSVRQARDSVASTKFDLSEDQVRRLDRVSLGRSTFGSSRVRRGLFVTLAGILILAYSCCLLFEEFLFFTNELTSVL